jgi:hypothetical protein
MRILVFVLSLILSSCATVFTGTSQNISLQAVDVETNKPIEGPISCTLTDSKGVSYIIPTNPGSVLVKKEYGPITPMCKKDGYVQRNFGVGSSFNAVSVVNILFWPGFLVDAATGSMHKYPSHITVFMERSK